MKTTKIIKMIKFKVNNLTLQNYNQVVLLIKLFNFNKYIKIKNHKIKFKIKNTNNLKKNKIKHLKKMI